MTTSRSGVWSSIAKYVTISFLNFALLLPVHAAFTLDTTFNGSGKVTVSFPDSSTSYRSRAFRVFVQPNNRILVVGSFSNITPDGQLSGVAWAGLTPSGALDPGFGSGGKFTDWRPDASTNFRDALMYADGSTLRVAQVFRLPVGSSTVQNSPPFAEWRSRRCLCFERKHRSMLLRFFQRATCPDRRQE